MLDVRPSRLLVLADRRAWQIGFAVLAAWLVAGPSVAVESGTVTDAHVEAQLVSEVTAAVPGEPFRVGLRMTMDPKWHTYWINPGDAGLTTKIKWTLPEGVEAGEIQWPTPIKFGEEQEIIGYGYEDTVLLPVEVTVPADFSGAELTLQARVDWLACKEACIPGRAELSISLPVVAAGEPDRSTHAEAFARADADMPQPTDDDFAVVWRDGEKLVLGLRLPHDALGEEGESPLSFYPGALGVVDDLAEQPTGQHGDLVTLTLTKSELFDEDTETLGGLVVIGEEGSGEQVSYAVDAEIRDIPPAIPAATPKNTTSLLTVLGSAIVGGLILNLMPCVFPVLALKITGFVQQAGENRGQIAAHGFAFAAGVLVSFWAIAAVVVAVQATGRELGWGFQLQSPVFVGAMAILLFAVGLNFAGLFDIGMSVMTTAGQASGKLAGGTLSGTFGSGVLATALATPCSAPFMSTAVGYALTATTATTVMVLTALGVGMALPYVLLSLFPAWLKALPKPGPWMETFKQLMAFPMFAVVAYLVWVFNNQTGGGLGLPLLLGALILAALGLWALGRWGRPSLSGTARWVSRLACLLLLTLSVSAVVTASSFGAASTTEASMASEDGLKWEPFSEARIAELRAAGHPVFVDFTADWCATCKFNERVFIDTADVRDTIAEHGVALVKADWTTRDDTITAALDAFGVRSVPYYVFYPADRAGEVVHFDSIYSQQKVIDAIKKVAGAG